MTEGVGDTSVEQSHGPSCSVAASLSLVWNPLESRERQEEGVPSQDVLRCSEGGPVHRVGTKGVQTWSQSARPGRRWGVGAPS